MPRVHNHRHGTKKKSQPARASGRRAGWRGMLRFGLVTFPVQAFNAHLRDEGAVAFHQLHQCGRRIHYEKVCPLHGAVPNDEIVSGFEVSKDKYVEIEPEELDALRTEKERALTLDAFIEPTELDPVYLDGRMYYLTPDGDAAAEPYAVLTAALKQIGRYAVGQLVLSGKEQVVLIRPYQGLLQMGLLNYEAEMLDPARLKLDLPSMKTHDRRVQMAEKLIESWNERHFDFGKYADRHLKEVRELIQAKSKGRKMEPPEEEAEEPEVINLLDALKKSMGTRSSTTTQRRTTPAKRKPATATHTKRTRTRPSRRAS